MLPGVQQELLRCAAEGRLETFADLLDNHFFACLLTSPDVLHSAFAVIPEEWLVERPRYLMARTILRSSTEPFMIPDTKPYQLFSEWVAAQPAPQTRDRLGMLHGPLRGRLAAGRFDEANEIADDALETIARAPEMGGFADVLPMILLEIGVAKVQVGDLHAALSVFGEAERWCTARGEHPVLPNVRGYIALVFALMDDFSHAMRFLPPNAPERAPRGTPLHRMQEAEMLARLLIAAGQLDRPLVDSMLGRIEDDIAYSQLWWIGAHVRAVAELYWGDARQGIRSLERTLLSRRHLVGGTTLAGAVLRADLADLNVSVGNFRASAHALRSPALNPANPFVCISVARAALAVEQPQKALLALSRSGHDLDLSRRFGVLKVAALTMLIGDAGEREWKEAVDEALRRGSFSALIDVPQAHRARAFASVASPIPDVPAPFALSRVELLSDRELEILTALGSHPTVASLAAAVFITPNTVRTHLKAAYRKLGVHSRQEALWELARHAELRDHGDRDPGSLGAMRS